MFLNIRKNQKGVSLLELVVAVSIFAVMILASTGIFQAIIESQRNAVSSQIVQEGIRYAMETISKEVRMAKRDDGTCGSSEIYRIDNNSLKFMNQYGECVSYFMENDGDVNRIKLKRNTSEAFVTASSIDVASLDFVLGSNSQAYVTIMMDVSSIGKDLHDQKTKIQTTISSRRYE